MLLKMHTYINNTMHRDSTLLCFIYESKFLVLILESVVILQKLIAFHEVTSVRRAKTAGIFPNAIEIFAGGKKVFLV